MEPKAAARSIMKGLPWSVALVAAVYVVTLGVTFNEGRWIVDNENRFLQVQALADNGFSEYAIAWPGRAVDPTYAHNPLRFNHEASFHEEKDGQLLSIFQPAFIVASAVLYKACGHAGLHLLPLAAAVLMLAGVFRLARDLGAGRGTGHLAVLLAGLATPAWFYSQVFWEHTVAACLVVWGAQRLLLFLAGGRRGDLAVGCALLAAALFFRDVLGLFYLVAASLVWWRSPGRRLEVALTAGGVLAAGVGLLMLFQGWLIDRPLGFHPGTLTESTAGPMQHLRDRVRVFTIFFAAAHMERWWSLAITAPFVLAFVWRPRLNDGRLRRLLPLWAAIALLATLAFLHGFSTAPSPLRNMLMANSFFLAAPWLIMGLLRAGDAPPTERAGAGWLLAAVWIYLVVYCLAAPVLGAVSLHWGARPVFSLYPLLAVPAALTVARWWEVRGRRFGGQALVVVALLLVSVAGQVYSLTLLERKKEFSVRLGQTAAGLRQEVIVTDVWWAGHELHRVFFDKQIYYLMTREEFDHLAPLLQRAGVREFVFVTRPRSGVRPDLRVDDGGLDFYSLDFIFSRLD